MELTQQVEGQRDTMAQKYAKEERCWICPFQAAERNEESPLVDVAMSENQELLRVSEVEEMKNLEAPLKKNVRLLQLHQASWNQ